MTTIEKYTDSRRAEILETWEQSVRVTHHFVTPYDLEEIKDLVHTIDFNRSGKKLSVAKNAIGTCYNS